MHEENKELKSMENNYYQLLGISEGANEADIVKAFHIQTLRYTLNFGSKIKTPEEEEKYLRLSNAYKVLLELHNPKRNDPLTKFADEIEGLSLNILPSTYKSSDVTTFVSKIKSCITNTANAHEKLIDNNYLFIKDYFHSYDIRLNKELIKFLAPIKNALINFLLEQDVDVYYFRNVILLHIDQMKRNQEFSEMGGHIKMDFTYLNDYYEIVGKRIMNLGYLLVHMEKLEEYSH